MLLVSPREVFGGAHTYISYSGKISEIGMVHSDIQTESKVTKTAGDCCDLRRKTINNDA